MEKEFETFDYLVKYNASAENNINTGQQIVIVQENGHFIRVDKPIEYISQEEDTKEFKNVSCPMYVDSQQSIYYQLNNPTEHTSIPVNPIPIDESSNMFENAYLLPNLTVEVIDPHNYVPHKHSDIPFSPNLKEEDEAIDIDANKPPGSYAEITLSDEQYEILKQKGWILLEMIDKVFLLDSSGLHEITHDQELITKLKYETSQITDKNNQLPGDSLKVVMIPEKENVNAGIEIKQETCSKTEPMETISELVTVHQDEIEMPATNNQIHIEVPSISMKTEECNNALSNCNNDTDQKKKKPSKIHIKTEYLLKDIPKEIFLGKTVNGKNLIARMIKGKGITGNIVKTNKDIKSQVGKDRHINDKQFAKLIQHVLLGTAENCRMEDVASAETVMSQIYRVPDLRLNLHKHKLIITKTVREENKNGLIENQSEPTVVTGRFVINGSEGRFVHIPDMLQEHMKNSELEKFGKKDCEKEIETAVSENDTFLHVNITETKDINNSSRISVMVNRLYLSLSQVYNMKTKHINAVYACIACAKIFKSQEELEEHQKQAKFCKLKECQDSSRVHNNETNQSTQPSTTGLKHIEMSEDKQQTNVFKCKMCGNTYFHSSSLTKHILAKHIKPRQ